MMLACSNGSDPDRTPAGWRRSTPGRSSATMASKPTGRLADAQGTMFGLTRRSGPTNGRPRAAPYSLWGSPAADEWDLTSRSPLPCTAGLRIRNSKRLAIAGVRIRDGYHAHPSDYASAIAFALRFQDRKRVHSADEIMAEIVAKRLVDHLERAGFVVMKRPPEIGATGFGRGFEG